MVEYGACLSNRFEVGRDGHTASSVASRRRQWTCSSCCFARWDTELFKLRSFLKQERTLVTDGKMGAHTWHPYSRIGLTSELNSLLRQEASTNLLSTVLLRLK